MFRSSILATAALCAVFAGAPLSPASAGDGRQGSTFNVNGDTIFYQQAGQGPDLLLIHGFPLNGALFQNQLSALSASFHVITVDLPGFGRSSTASNTQTDASYARDLFALLAHLNVTKAIIGGHSMGGQITLQMYTQNPTLFSGMILFDTNPVPASIVEMNEWPGFGAQARAMKAASLAPMVAPIMVTGRALMDHPTFNTQLTQMVSAGSPAGVTAGASALVTRPDFQPMLDTISVPTLVVVGQDDSLYAYPISQSLQLAIPGAQLLIIPNAGHASMYQSPQTADNGILSWATGHGLIP